MNQIHEIIKELLKNINSPTIIECGGHNGIDTVELAKIPNSDIYTLEPLPINFQKLCNNTSKFKNINRFDLAISDFNGEADFYVSDDPEHFQGSSSLLKPTRHLDEFKHVVFNKKIKVQVCTLDDFIATRNIKKICFQWWDSQGAAGKIIKGGQKALSITKYLYTEAYNVSMYDGEPTQEELIKMLPHWEVLYRWPTDILFRNTKYE